MTAIIRILTFLIVALAAVVLYFTIDSARAEEAKKPTYEQLEEQVAYWRAIAQGAIQQRDAANSAVANQVLEASAQAAVKSEKEKK